MKDAILIKTRVGYDGKQWTIIQIQETKFFYTILCPLEIIEKQKIARELLISFLRLRDIWIIVEIKL
jgi:hypothetical protein